MNYKDSAHIGALLKKYREEKCTPEEAKRVEKWLSDLSRKTNDGAHYGEGKYLKAARKKVIKNTALQRSVYVIMRPYLRIAAALLLIQLAYIFYTDPAKPVVATKQQFNTLAGERKIIMLPDSTEVVLNASSVLTVSADFNQNYRNVKLSGEAYFRVAHDSTRPFIVSTGKLKTRVLGTEFNVHAYNNESSIKVAVLKGRVRVSKQQQQNGIAKQLGRILTHNIMLKYDLNSEQFITTSADAEKIGSWQNGELYFEDANIEEIVMALSRHYNREIQLVDKPLGKCNYTIGFLGEPLPKVLGILSQLTGITYETAQNKIIIYSKNCH